MKVHEKKGKGKRGKRKKMHQKWRRIPVNRIFMGYKLLNTPLPVNKSEFALYVLQSKTEFWERRAVECGYLK